MKYIYILVLTALLISCGEQISSHETSLNNEETVIVETFSDDTELESIQSELEQELSKLIEQATQENIALNAAEDTTETIDIELVEEIVVPAETSNAAHKTGSSAY